MRIPQGTGIDHVRTGTIAGRACRPTAGAIAREGARLLLTIALEEEVTDFLKRRPYERSHGNIRGYRNGHREHQVSCGAGEIEVVEGLSTRDFKRAQKAALGEERPLPLQHFTSK